MPASAIVTTDVGSHKYLFGQLAARPRAKRICVPSPVQPALKVPSSARLVMRTDRPVASSSTHAVRRDPSLHSGLDLQPAFSPAGDGVAFVSDRRGAIEIYVRGAGGGTGVSFSMRAVDVIYGLSGGVPRLVNPLSKRALQEGATLASHRMEPGMIRVGRLGPATRPPAAETLPLARYERAIASSYTAGKSEPVSPAIEALLQEHRSSKAGRRLSRSPEEHHAVVGG